MQAKAQEDKAQEDAAVDDSKFDEFMGNDAGAFASFGEYDQDDREADAEWDRVDDIMDERRRDRHARSHVTAKKQLLGDMKIPVKVSLIGNGVDVHWKSKATAGL